MDSQQVTAAALSLEVEGLPPAKSEALSMLGVGHSHAPRVRRLLEVARAAANTQNFEGFDRRLIGMRVVLRTPGEPPSDATNYLGGIADVLEAKGHRGRLDHLGDLAQVALYDNDRQIREVHFSHEQGPEGYLVEFWAL
jgi:hypothetical protein